MLQTTTYVKWTFLSVNYSSIAKFLIKGMNHKIFSVASCFTTKKLNILHTLTVKHQLNSKYSINLEKKCVFASRSSIVCALRQQSALGLDLKQFEGSREANNRRPFHQQQKSTKRLRDIFLHEGKVRVSFGLDGPSPIV